MQEFELVEAKHKKLVRQVNPTWTEIREMSFAKNDRALIDHIIALEKENDRLMVKNARLCRKLNSAYRALRKARGLPKSEDQ